MCKKVTNLAYFQDFEKHRKFSFSDDLVKSEEVLSDSFYNQDVTSIDVNEIKKKNCREQNNWSPENTYEREE